MLFLRSYSYVHANVLFLLSRQKEDELIVEETILFHSKDIESVILTKLPLC